MMYHRLRWSVQIQMRINLKRNRMNRFGGISLHVCVEVGGRDKAFCGVGFKACVEELMILC